MALPEPDADVVARVKTLAAASVRPVLSTDDVVASIKGHPMADADGLTADIAEWTQTWNLYAIVAELWGIKAGRVAGDFNFSADDARYDKGEVMANCLEMEARYAAKLAGSAVTGLGGYRDPLSGVVVNG